MHTQVRAYNGHISKRHLIIIIKGNVARFPVQQFAETLFWQRRVWVFFWSRCWAENTKNSEDK